jgi:hypothetical protein
MKTFWMFFVLFGGLSLASFAQDDTAKSEVTDDDLKKFASMEVMTVQYVEKKTGELKNMIINNEVIAGGARYNEIKAAWGNAGKEEEIKLSFEVWTLLHLFAQQCPLLSLLRLISPSQTPHAFLCVCGRHRPGTGHRRAGVNAARLGDVSVFTLAKQQQKCVSTGSGGEPPRTLAPSHHTHPRIHTHQAWPEILDNLKKVRVYGVGMPRAVLERRG